MAQKSQSLTSNVWKIELVIARYCLSILKINRHAEHRQFNLSAPHSAPSRAKERSEERERATLIDFSVLPREIAFVRQGRTEADTVEERIFMTSDDAEFSIIPSAVPTLIIAVHIPTTATTTATFREVMENKQGKYRPFTMRQYSVPGTLLKAGFADIRGAWQ